MDIKQLQTLVFDALEDVKAQDILVYDTTHLTSLFDRVAIASGTSNRQTKALAASVRDKVKQHGGDVIGMEGEGTGEWVLVDLGDMVVHIMQPAIRAYYRLEEIWGDKEVKFGAAKRGTKKLPTASEDEDVKPKRASRAKSAAVEVTHDMMASQTTLDDEPKKTTRKPRAAKAASADAPAKPVRKSTAAAGSTGVKKTSSKTPSGTRVKVAATKTAVASAKKAADKKATTRRKTAE
ncbi:ribosome silencing factor [Undibacterium sp. Jales W-56]|uniref:ribosome silencing factor n=1 Tax=Undibacterium sp. Jales W-56 TaxID=2897325 RepID=UPI0021D13DF0|nr:ribosome silencing factor [Undibacterium sp. Jales W-56]MCU6435774.1 ribosome silencing factor [Undibacterium sp. Jales W-56]